MKFKTTAWHILIDKWRTNVMLLSNWMWWRKINKEELYIVTDLNIIIANYALKFTLKFRKCDF